MIALLGSAIANYDLRSQHSHRHGASVADSGTGGGQQLSST